MEFKALLDAHYPAYESRMRLTHKGETPEPKSTFENLIKACLRAVDPAKVHYGGVVDSLEWRLT